MLEVPEFPPSIKNVIWENYAPDKVHYKHVYMRYIIDVVFFFFFGLQHVFVASDSDFVYTYVYYRDTINGKYHNN